MLMNLRKVPKTTDLTCPSNREPVELYRRRRLTITFMPQGVEYAVTCAHTDEPPTPGTKTRTARASRMVRKALEAALEGLGAGAVAWGGYNTNTKASTDRILVEGGGGGR